MNVPDASRAQMPGERFSIKLRIVAGTRHAANVHNALYAMRLQNLDEFLERPGGMPDRENCWLRFFAARAHAIRSSECFAEGCYDKRLCPRVRIRRDDKLLSARGHSKR